MAKDKKKKDKKPGKDRSAGGFKGLAENPLVADVVSAALVATAAALKDTGRARALASEAGEELGKLSKAGAERGNILWDMALQIGRRSLEAFGGEAPKPSKTKTKSSPAEKRAPKAARAKPKAAKKKTGKAAAR